MRGTFGPEPVILDGLGYDYLTHTLYANGFFLFDLAAGSALFTVNKLTGAATFVGHHLVPVPPDAGRQLGYSGLAFDPADHTLYSLGSITGSTGGLYAVDPLSGAPTLRGNLGINTVDGGLAFIPGPTAGVPVPEPGAAALLALAGAASALRARCRRQT